MRCNPVALTVLLLLVLFCSLPGRAQIEQSGILSATSLANTNLAVGSTNYYYAKPNELTIVVNIMGFVQKPGRYEIASSIDLLNLLALAGGANADGTLNDVMITRLVKSDTSIERKSIELNLEDLSTVTNASLVLSPGDIIRVHRSGWSTVKDILYVAVSAAVIVTATATVVLLTRN